METGHNTLYKIDTLWKNYVLFLYKLSKFIYLFLLCTKHVWTVQISAVNSLSYKTETQRQMKLIRILLSTWLLDQKEHTSHTCLWPFLKIKFFITFLPILMKILLMTTSRRVFYVSVIYCITNARKYPFLSLQKSWQVFSQKHIEHRDCTLQNN